MFGWTINGSRFPSLLEPVSGPAVAVLAPPLLSRSCSVSDHSVIACCLDGWFWPLTTVLLSTSNFTKTFLVLVPLNLINVSNREE